MAEIRLPIVANLSLDDQNIIDLGPQRLGPDHADEAARRGYVDMSALPVGTVGGSVLGVPASGTDNVTGEVDANFLRVVNPGFDPDYASGGDLEDLTDARAARYYYIPVAGSLASLSDTTITTPADNQFLRYNGTSWINEVVNLADINNVEAIPTNATGRILQVSSTNTYVHATLAAALENNTTGAGIQNLNNVPNLPAETATADQVHSVLVWDDADNSFSWVGSNTANTFLSQDGSFSQPVFANLSGVASGITTAGTNEVLTISGGNVDNVTPKVRVFETGGGNVVSADTIEFVGAAVQITGGSGSNVNRAIVTISGTGGGSGTPLDVSFTEANDASKSYNDQTDTNLQATFTYTFTVPNTHYIPGTDETDAMIDITKPNATTAAGGKVYTWPDATLAVTTTNREIGPGNTATDVITGGTVTILSPEGFVGDAASLLSAEFTLRPNESSTTDTSEDTEITKQSTPQVYQELYYARYANTSSRTTNPVASYIHTTGITGADHYIANSLVNDIHYPIEDGFNFTIATTTPGTQEWMAIWVPNTYSASPIIFDGGLLITPQGNEIVPGATVSGATPSQVDGEDFEGEATGIHVGYRMYVLPSRRETIIESDD